MFLGSVVSSSSSSSTEFRQCFYPVCLQSECGALTSEIGSLFENVDPVEAAAAAAAAAQIRQAEGKGEAGQSRTHDESHAVCVLLLLPAAMPVAALVLRKTVAAIGRRRLPRRHWWYCTSFSLGDIGPTNATMRQSHAAK